MKIRRLEIEKHGVSLRVNTEGVIDYASSPAYQWAINKRVEAVTEWLRGRSLRYHLHGWRPRRGEA